MGKGYPLGVSVLEQFERPQETFTVAVVDDQNDIAEMAQDMLEIIFEKLMPSYSFDIQKFSNAQDLIDGIIDGTVQNIVLILSDVNQMPRETNSRSEDPAAGAIKAIAAFKEIRRLLGETVPFILMSGHEPNLRNHIITEYASNTIEKPLDMNKLKVIIRDALEELKLFPIAA